MLRQHKRFSLKRAVVSAALLLLLASGPGAVIHTDNDRPPPRRVTRGQVKPSFATAARSRNEGNAAGRRARSRTDGARPDAGSPRVMVDGGIFGAARMNADAGMMVRTLPDGGVYSEYGVPDLTVPFADAEVPVQGVMEVNGLPMKLKAIHSTLPPEELYAHFLKEFQSKGLYVDQNVRIPGYSNPHITGLDPVRGISYTALLTREPVGTTVFLGEAHLSARRPPEVDGVPILPGARSIMRANVELARQLSYVVAAPPERVKSFYDDELKKLGFAANADGAYEKDGVIVSLDTQQNAAKSETSVQLLIRQTR